MNALEPGTELPVHRHIHTSETYIVLRGKIRVMFFDAEKSIKESVMLDSYDGKYGINISVGQWHTLQVLEKGTVIFEVKDRPYAPLKEEDILF